MDLPEVLTLLNTGGVVAALALMVWALQSGRVVPSALLRDVIGTVVEELLKEIRPMLIALIREALDEAKRQQ